MKDFKNTKAQWPISLEELLLRNYQWERFNKKSFSFIFVVLILMYYGVLQASKHVPGLDVQFPINPYMSIAIMILVFTVTLIPILGLTKYGLKQYGLVCGGCHRVLGRKAFSLAVETCECSKCRHELVSNRLE